MNRKCDKAAIAYSKTMPREQLNVQMEGVGGYARKILRG